MCWPHHDRCSILLKVSVIISACKFICNVSDLFVIFSLLLIHFAIHLSIFLLWIPWVDIINNCSSAKPAYIKTTDSNVIKKCLLISFLIYSLLAFWYEMLDWWCHCIKSVAYHCWNRQRFSLLKRLLCDHRGSTGRPAVFSVSHNAEARWCCSESFNISSTCLCYASTFWTQQAAGYDYFFGGLV